MPTAMQYWSIAQDTVYLANPAGIARVNGQAQWGEMPSGYHDYVALAAGLWDDVCNVTMAERIDSPNLAGEATNLITVIDKWFGVEVGRTTHFETVLPNDWTRLALSNFSNADGHIHLGINTSTGAVDRYHEAYIDTRVDGIGPFTIYGGSLAFQTLLQELGRSVIGNSFVGTSPLETITAVNPLDSIYGDPAIWHAETPMLRDIDIAIALYGAAT